MQVFGPQGIPDARPPAVQGGAAAPMDPGGMPPPGAGPLREGGLPVPVRPGMLSLQTPGGMPMQPGMMLRGQVLARQGDMVTLQMGRNVFTANTSLPLDVGAFIDMQVQGQQQGKWMLQLVGSQLFTPMTEQDLGDALQTMRLPVNDSNLELARTMVEFSVPLTASDLKELSRALAQLPPEAGKETAMAACFLKAGNLPLVPQNIMTLANFITQHPLIGMQLFQLQQSFRRLVETGGRDRLPRELAELLARVPGALSELALDPTGRNMRKLYADMRRMAFQAGIERMGPHVGDDFDMLEWLESLRQQLAPHEEASPELFAMRALLRDLGENLSAHRLLNAAVAEQGAYYLQLPLLGSHLTVEARLIYHIDSHGRPVLDAENLDLEIVVPTENLGEVVWQVAVRHGVVSFEVSVDEKDAQAHLSRFLPVLVDNLEKMGYHVQAPAPSCQCRGKKEKVGAQPMACREFETLERVNLQI